MAKIQHFVGNSVVKKAAFLRRLTSQLHTYLPAQFIESCQVAEFSDNSLTIAVSSPAWSHQVRYYVPLIKKQFQVEKVKILVCPEMAGVFQCNQHKQQVSKQLDAQASTAIRETAESITDPKLKKAMLKLAQHGPRKTS